MLIEIWKAYFLHFQSEIDISFFYFNEYIYKNVYVLIGFERTQIHIITLLTLIIAMKYLSSLKSIIIHSLLYFVLTFIFILKVGMDFKQLEQEVFAKFIPI
jgi:hypothetical protein